MDLSTINKAFHSSFLEVIKFDRLVNLINVENPNLTTDFIIDSLDVEREKLEKIKHDIPLIFVDKNTILEKINGRNFILPTGQTIYDWGKFEVENVYDVETIPSYDYQEWKWGLTFNLLNYYPINRSAVYASIDSTNKRGTFKTFDSFNIWLDEFHSSLNSNDIYILKRDALTLVTDLSIPDEDISLIKYNRFIANCDNSDFFSDMTDYDEFEKCGACDLAFDIWKNDKSIFEKIIKNEPLTKPRIANTDKDSIRLKQALKLFITVSYGEEVANKIRSNIAENDTTQGVKYSDGAIQKAFDKKGYKVPFSGRYLADMLKDVDISEFKTN